MQVLDVLGARQPDAVRQEAWILRPRAEDPTPLDRAAQARKEHRFVAAFDLESGEEQWRRERTTDSTWGTPLITEVNGKAQVIEL